MLTLQDLKDMKPNTAFAMGRIRDNPRGINMDNTNMPLKWVACRGEIHDWAIYIYTADKTKAWVKAHGNKVTAHSHIRRVVPCDDEALAMYRH